MIVRLRSPLFFDFGFCEVRLKHLPGFLLHYRGHEVVVDGWRFNAAYGAIYLAERERWVAEYLPSGGVKGLTILDVGAGCGESAKFFLDNGAKRVIAIEPYGVAFKYLLENSKSHAITPLNEVFRPEMLAEIPHDVCKIDIEGYEALLLDNEILKNYSKPIVVEAHYLYVRDRLRDLYFRQFSGGGLNEQWRGGCFIMQRGF